MDDAHRVVLDSYFFLACADHVEAYFVSGIAQEGEGGDDTSAGAGLKRGGDPAVEDVVGTGNERAVAATTKLQKSVAAVP